MALNTKAEGLAPHARTGKDGAMYDDKGTLLATVENFQSQVSFNNAQFSVLGNPLELETLSTHKITLTFSQVVVQSDKFVLGLKKFFEKGTPINWKFQGVLKSKGGKSQERWVYKNCMPSGQVDLQNITTGDVVKRQWSFAVNSEPVLQKQLSMKK